MSYTLVTRWSPMDWMGMLSAAITLGLFVLVGLVAAWAWHEHQLLLAVPLTMIFIASAIGLVMFFDKYGMP